jgi:hypothetical protein
MRMAFHIVIICLRGLSEVLHSQFYGFMLLLPPPALRSIFLDVAVHSYPIKVVTVDREVFFINSYKFTIYSTIEQ